MITVIRRNKTSGKVHDIIDRNKVTHSMVTSNLDYAMLLVHTDTDLFEVAIRGDELPQLIKLLSDELKRFNTVAPFHILDTATTAEVMRHILREELIPAIRLIRERTGLDLKEARDQCTKVLCEHKAQGDRLLAETIYKLPQVPIARRLMLVDTTVYHLKTFGPVFAAEWVAKQHNLLPTLAHDYTKVVEVYAAAAIAREVQP